MMVQCFSVDLQQAFVLESSANMLPAYSALKPLKPVLIMGKNPTV